MAAKLKLSYEFEVESFSSSPYESGYIEIQIRERGLGIRWLGEPEWKTLEWHDIAGFADAKTPKLSEELQWIKDTAWSDGYNDGLQCGLDAARRKGELTNIDAAVERLKMAFRHREVL